MLKPSFLEPGEIADKANEFRQLFVKPPDQVPLDIEKVIETVLKIRIDPKENLSRISRKYSIPIDAFLTNDRLSIVVDYDEYISDQGRLKFTLAHELGHWFLHKKQYESVRYKSIEDFIKIQKSLDNKYRNWFEFQANEFAANLLVPTDSLFLNCQMYLHDIKKAKKEGKIWVVKNEIAEDLAQKFDVSSEVIKNRMTNEKIIESLMEE